MDGLLLTGVFGSGSSDGSVGSRPVRSAERPGAVEPATDPVGSEGRLVLREQGGRPLELAVGHLSAHERHLDLGDLVAAELEVADAPAVVGAARLGVARRGR